MSRYDDGYGDDRRNDRGYYAGGGERERGGYAPAERERVPAAYEERRGGGADPYERERGGYYERRPPPADYDRGYDRGYYERPPEPRGGYYERAPEPRRGGGGGGGYERAPPPSAGASRRLYVGNLPRDIRRGDLDAEFSRFGRVEAASVFPDARAPFGFVEFVDARDADAALRAMHGRDFMGNRLRVEISQGRAREPAPAGPGNSTSTGTFKKSDFRVLVLGLGANVGWKELKDFGREVGRVHYTAAKTVGAERVGLIEFVDQESMDKALATLVRCWRDPPPLPSPHCGDPFFSGLTTPAAAPPAPRRTRPT